MSDMHETVRKAYAGWASGNGRVPRDQGKTDLIAQAMGYSAEELESLPAAANMGLSCGNSLQFANIRPGETVLDLGSGGGLDVFLASKRVGPTGRVIGVDMTPEMIALARRNAEKGGYKNVEFVQSLIEDMDVASNSIDCAISNCVLNLCPDKAHAFRDIHRVLKPGGRLVASDIALLKPLPPHIRDSLNAYVGCIAGALLADDYERMLREAGFADVRLVKKSVDLNAYNKLGTENSGPSTGAGSGSTSCCAPAAAVDISTGCCAPKTAASKAGACCEPKAGSSCCAPASAPDTTSTAQHEERQSCCAPPKSKVDLGDAMAEMGVDYDPNEFAASFAVFAVKAA